LFPAPDDNEGVKLPVAPSSGSQLLLQTIWDLSGMLLRWPTYAELDRQIDLLHGEDALQLIRATPQAFVRGVDHRSGVPPQDRQQIGLTVAGAAVCSNSATTLKAFVQFVRKAAEIQKFWAPTTPTDNQSPSLTSAEAAAFLDIPDGMASVALAQLYLLLDAEPWGGFSSGANEAEGTWSVYFDRRVRPFRDVVDLEDYWERRYRPEEWDAELAPNPEVSAQHSRPVVSADLVASQIAEHGRSARVLASELQAERAASLAEIEHALDVLEQQGTVVLTRTDDDVVVLLTEDGWDHINEAEAMWNDRRRREPALRDALMAWLYDVERDSLTGYVVVDGFLTSDRNSLGGHLFFEQEVDRAAAYLEDRRLIEGTHVDQRRGPVQARLTAAGISCMEKNQGVERYLDLSTSGTTNIFYGPVTGTNLAWGDNANQHATVTGVDADGLRTLAQAIIQALPGLSLDMPERHDVEAAVSEVTAATESETPDKKRLGRALVVAQHALSSAGNQALSIVLSAAINHALGALGWSNKS
jgi:hypothetical protein